MSVFQHIPLGHRIPDSVHGVSCSLPTMRAVIGYEEKHPEILQQMTSGYPRFVQHPYLKQASAHVREKLKLDGNDLWLTASAAAAEGLARWIAAPGAEVIHHQGLSGVTFPRDPDLFARAKTFLQHTGKLLSSREAEDYLVREGVLAQAYPEPSFEGYAPARVKGAVSRAFPLAGPEDIFLANSGMNAIYAAFRCADSIQREKGRTIWIQIGWLYLDTIAILQKFTTSPGRDHVYLSDVFDLETLREVFRTRGAQIAGVITEVPTNPLLQTPDLPAIHDLCREHGAILIVDPTISSPLNISVLPHSDIAVNSLTKYAASEGDVIMGAVVTNPESPFATAVHQRLPAELEPVYSRDISRLASQVADFESVVTRVNHSTAKVVDFLGRHPGIRELHWSRQPDSAANYAKIARSASAMGGMISFIVRKPLAQFYDALRLPKGPSFGMKRTLICPFIYLAHYDLVTSEAGRRTLQASGLSPELLRMSIGCEPVEDIIAALDEALA